MERNPVSDDSQSCTTDDESQFATPALKLDLRQASSPDDRSDTALHSVGASSDLSLKEGSVFSSSSASSSGSESESGCFLKKRATQEVSNQTVLKDPLEKVAFYEGELKSAHEKIWALEFELAQNAAANLHDKFNETKILQLQDKVEALEAKIEDSDLRNSLLIDELDSTKEKLRASEKEVMELEHKMETEVDFANEEARALKVELDDRNQVIQDLNIALRIANQQLEKLQSKLEQAESVKTEMKNALESQEKRLASEIAQLKIENSQKSEQVDALNKRLDAIMFKCDMVAAERDGLTAMVDKLNAEAECNVIKIRQMEDERSRLLADFEKMRFRAGELENVTDSQRAVILDRDEEKREAIRQLCFAVEYYRTEYQQVCRAFGGHRRQPGMAKGH